MSSPYENCNYKGSHLLMLELRTPRKEILKHRVLLNSQITSF